MTTIASRTHTHIPSLPALPLLGNVFALRNDRLKLLLRISHKVGDIGAFHFGPRLVPLINSPDLVRCVLVDQSAMFQKTATVRKLASPVLGNGVFLSEGEEHRQQRRLLAPLSASPRSELCRDNGQLHFTSAREMERRRNDQPC